MITITIPFIPSLLAILSFTLLLFTEIDESDRILTFFICALVSAIIFFASYGLFSILGAF